MKVKIKLKDPRYCDDCRFCNWNVFMEYGFCRLYQGDALFPPLLKLKKTKKEIHIIRLKECIKEYGK